MSKNESSDLQPGQKKGADEANRKKNEVHVYGPCIMAPCVAAEFGVLGATFVPHAVSECAGGELVPRH